MLATDLTTDQKGAIAEAEIAAAAIKGGKGVYRPLFEGGRYDLIFDIGTRLVGVQCKWALLGDDVVIARCYSARRAPEGMRVRKYTAAEIDVCRAVLRGDRSELLPSCEAVRRKTSSTSQAGSVPQQSAARHQLGG